MAKFNATMFDRIKDALNKSSSSTSSGQFENIMKFPAGHIYTLRLLPITEEGKEPLFHHWTNSWNSKATGSFISTIALKTFGEKDPITELRWKLWKEWKDANPKADNKEYSAEISEKEQWFVNVYVIDDPANPENNGTVKVLRMGPQLKEIVDASTEGDKAEELGLGWEIFDPTAGHDLKIVAEKQGPFTTFKNSYFTPKSKTTLTESEVETIYESLHDLESIYAVKTYDELTELLNNHFYCENKGSSETNVEKKSPPPAKKTAPKKQAAPVVEDNDDDDEIPMFHDSDSAENVDELLAGLDL